MATYHECPNCGNTEEGIRIYGCDNCSFVGCYAEHFIGSDGCWKASECPKCGKDDISRLGYIEPED